MRLRAKLAFLLTTFSAIGLAGFAVAENRISGYAQSYALCSVNGEVANTPTATPEIVASTWTVGASSSDWTVTTGGRLTYSGIETRAFRFLYTGGVNSDANANNDRCSLTLAKGGSSIAASTSDWDGDTAGVHLAVPVAWIDETVATGDYFELFVAIDDATNDPEVAVDHGVFSVWGGR